MTELAALPSVRSPERQTLEEFLGYFRSVFIRKADGLSDEQARHRVGASELDLLGLVRHMAYVERFWFRQALQGDPIPDRWVNPLDPDDPDPDFHHQPADTLADAVAAWHEEVAAARATCGLHESLDDVTAVDVGPPDNPDRYGRRSLRWVLVHMIEEYARHCGHADLIREAIDGAVGD